MGFRVYRLRVSKGRRVEGKGERELELGRELEFREGASRRISTHARESERKIENERACVSKVRTEHA